MSYRLGCLALWGFALLGCCAPGWSRERDRLQVQIESGVLLGSADDGVVSFKGIPYAAPPTGALRWRAPQAPAKWRGTRAATQFGHDCLQTPFPGDLAPSRVSFDEDCLYLNVWRPAGTARRLPVMVWIHGGGFVNGGSSPLVYDGTGFGRSGVVLVSLNYRLGKLGFFAHPALSAEQQGKPLGNYGLLDQIAALQWVQHNIARFGGDPHHVTLFGESAGGISVHMLLSAPAARGLFQQAIIESGAGRPGPFGSRPLTGAPNSAEVVGLKLAAHFGIEGTDAAALAKLRAIPGEQLGDIHMGTMSADVSYIGGPLRDGMIVADDPTELYRQGRTATIPVIVGANDADLGFAQGNTVEELLQPFGANSAAARAIYDPTGHATAKEVAALVGGAAFLIEPARHVARLMAAGGGPVFEYRFSYVAESMRARARGAAHASEIPYVFNTIRAVLKDQATAADLAMARAVHAYWVGFSKAGVPRDDGAPAWPRYQPTSDVIMDFRQSGPVVEADRWRKRLDLVEVWNDSLEGERRAPGRPSEP